MFLCAEKAKSSVELPNFMKFFTIIRMIRSVSFRRISGSAIELPKLYQYGSPAAEVNLRFFVSYGQADIAQNILSFQIGGYIRLCK